MCDDVICTIIFLSGAVNIQVATRSFNHSVGDTARMYCTVTNSNGQRVVGDDVTVTWLHNGDPLSELLTDHYELSDANHLFIIPKIVAQDSGRYACRVETPDDVSVSEEIEIEVHG